MIPLFFPETRDHHRDSLVNRQTACVKDDIRTHRRFVWVVDARETGEFAPACSGVKAFHVALLAFFERSRDIYLNEISTQTAHESPRFLVWRDQRGDDDHSVTLQPAGDESDAAHVRIALCAREARLRKNLPDRVTVEMLRGLAPAVELRVDSGSDGTLS